MKKKQPNLNSHDFVFLAAQALIAKNGVNVVGFNVAKTSPLTDFYLIVTGKNPPHMKALANELRVRLKEKGSLCFKKAGDPESGWIVADYIDVIVNIMSEEARRYYALEDLWKDSEVLQIPCSSENTI